MIKILLIENDRIGQKILHKQITQQTLPYDVITLTSVIEAKRMLDNQIFDLILVGNNFDDGTGFDIVAMTTPNIPTIFIVDSGRQETAAKALRAGASDYLIKDSEYNYLKILPDKINSALKKQELIWQTHILSAALRSTKDSIYIVDENNNIYYVNKAFCQTYHFSMEEIIGQPCSILFDDWDTISSEMLASPQFVAREMVHKKKDGTLFPVSVSRSLLNDEITSISVSYVVTVQDITQRKFSEKKLAESTNLYRLLADNIYDLVALHQPEGDLIYISPSCHKILGFAEEELYGFQPNELIHPDDVEKTKKIYHQAVSHGETLIAATYRMRTKSGNYIWLETYSTPILDDEGGVCQLLAVSRDISQRKRIEEELQTREAYLHSLLNTQNALVLRTDMDGNYSYVNDAMHSIYRWMYPRKKDMIGSPSLATIIDEDHIKAYNAIEECIKKPNTSVQIELRKPTEDGGFFTAVWEFMALTNYEDHLTEIQCVGIDISERKAIEERNFEIAIEKERLAVITKFIQDAAHEFRTPLSIIGTSSYLMSKNDNINYRKEKYEHVEFEINRITKLLNMLSLLVKLENGAELHLSDIHLKPILELSCDVAKFEKETNPSIKIIVPNNTLTIQADSVLFPIVLQELINNAIRNTPSNGYVTISLLENQEDIKIKVEDTGIGISKKDLSHIFDTFWRKDIAHSTSGFGLGLPIAKRIVEKHAGTLVIDSILGHGTICVITLPR